MFAIQYNSVFQFQNRATFNCVSKRSKGAHFKGIDVETPKPKLNIESVLKLFDAPSGKRNTKCKKSDPRA